MVTLKIIFPDRRESLMKFLTFRPSRYLRYSALHSNGFSPSSVLSKTSNDSNFNAMSCDGPMYGPEVSKQVQRELQCKEEETTRHLLLNT